MFPQSRVTALVDCPRASFSLRCFYRLVMITSLYPYYSSSLAFFMSANRQFSCSLRPFLVTSKLYSSSPLISWVQWSLPLLSHPFFLFGLSCAIEASGLCHHLTGFVSFQSIPPLEEHPYSQWKPFSVWPLSISTSPVTKHTHTVTLLFLHDPSLPLSLYWEMPNPFTALPITHYTFWLEC